MTLSNSEQGRMVMVVFIDVFTLDEIRGYVAIPLGFSHAFFHILSINILRFSIYSQQSR